MNNEARKYLAAIGRRGGKAGKGSAAKAASAKKANAARWEKHRKSKCVAAKSNAGPLATPPPTP